MMSGETFSWKMWVAPMYLDNCSKDFFVHRFGCPVMKVGRGSGCVCSCIFLVLQGMTLLMMGSAEALPEEPAVRPMFVEDMTEEQLASAVSQPKKFQCRQIRRGDYSSPYWPHQLTIFLSDVYNVDGMIISASTCPDDICVDLQPGSS